MLDRLAADAVVALHLAFVVFAALGGMLAWRRLAYAWFHLPALAWAAFVEFSGSICPLTPLENRLRVRAGEAGYSGSFVEHYLMPVLYPAGLTPDAQKWIGAALVALNLAIYAVALARARSRKGER
ncbi:MAG TPA: DUF2784 domain-containing protein [Casimicrobiaceae bacterium]|jgi:hypothetical protein